MTESELYKSLYDGYDLYELVDLLIQSGIIDKDTLLGKYWDEIEEAGEEIRPFC